MTFEEQYNLLVKNLVKAVNDGIITETYMTKTLSLVNSGGDDFLINQILNDGGENIIKYFENMAKHFKGGK